MKCEICEAEIKERKLGKIGGTYVKEGGKMHPICSNCQKEGEGKLKGKIGKRV